MKEIIIILFSFMSFANCIAQSTFSKIIDLEQGFDQLPSDLNFRNNEIIVASVHNCAKVSGFDPCTSLTFFDFNGEIKDIKLIDDFRLVSGSSMTINNDILQLVGNDYLNNNIGISHVNYNFLDNQYELGRTYIDSTNRYLSEGLLHTSNNNYVYGKYDDLSPGVKIRGFVSKWDKDFNNLEAIWSYLEDGFVSVRDLQYTVDSSFVFIAHTTNAGAGGGLPLHLIKIDSLGNTLAKFSLESDKKSINLEEDSSGSLYFNINYSFETSIAKIDSDLTDIIWEVKLPVDNHTLNQRYLIEDLEVASNGDILFCGEIYCNHEPNGLLVGGVIGRITSTGELLWMKVLANENLQENSWGEKYRDSYLTHLQELPSGNIVAMGQSWQLFLDFEQVRSLWLVSMDENGCIEGFDCDEKVTVLISGTNDVLHDSQKISIFPNPVTDRLEVNNLEGLFTYEIQNIQGKILAHGASEKSIDVSQLISGIYFLQISQQDKIYQSKKFIKL